MQHTWAQFLRRRESSPEELCRVFVHFIYTTARTHVSQWPKLRAMPHSMQCSQHHPNIAQPTQPPFSSNFTQSAPLPDKFPVHFLRSELVSNAVILVSCSVMKPSPGSRPSKQADCRPTHASPATQHHATVTHQVLRCSFQATTSWLPCTRSRFA